MLHKLLKYNLRAVYIPLSVFYLIALTCAIVGRIFQGYDHNLLLKIIHEFFSGAALGLCFGIVINNATRIWEHTKRDFYGDQSYLTHTLPVSRSTLYLAKFYTILITTLTSLLVIAVVLLINYITPDFFQFIDQLIRDSGSTFNFIKYVTLLVFTLFLEVIFIIQAGITGIILGHKMNSQKSLMSFVFGFAIFVISNFITVVAVLIWGIFDSQIASALQGSISDSIATKLFCGSIFAYIIYITATFCIAQKSLQQGIDVE